MRLPSVYGPDVAWECFGSCEMPYLWTAWCSAIAYQKSTQEHWGRKEEARNRKKEERRKNQEARSRGPEARSAEHQAARKKQEARSKKKM